MKSVRLLDCTLRDGGRILNCQLSDDTIRKVARGLDDANIDIIEIGFLRDSRLVDYNGNSTFYTNTSQIIPFLNKSSNALYVVFIDYGMFDFSRLERNDGSSIDGIRLGFTKKDYERSKDDVIKCMRQILDLGYKLFVQSVNTPGYTDDEILELVSEVNKLKVYSFGIVDTYGCMYEEDLEHYYSLVDKNLNKSVFIDFHSHNNYQMSFALCQRIIKLSEGTKRRVIIDATLNGMGRGAGNLSLELILEYLIRKKHYNYDLDCILDTIDDNLKDIKKNNTWGYSIPALFSGVYKCHPNNIIYLTDKFDLASKDIKRILESIDPIKRERYDYENLQKICSRYIRSNDNYDLVIDLINRDIHNKNILVLMPGSSVKKYESEIMSNINENKPLVMTVNFYEDNQKYNVDWVFFGSAERYRQYKNKVYGATRTIVTSNIKPSDDDMVVSFDRLAAHCGCHINNSAIMCLNLLKECDVERIMIAGFDGYCDDAVNYVDSQLQGESIYGEAKLINEQLQKMFDDFCNAVDGKVKVELITPSHYKIP